MGIKLSTEDVGEICMAASAAVGLFPRVEIDPEVTVELCSLATEALRARAEATCARFFTCTPGSTDPRDHSAECPNGATP